MRARLHQASLVDDEDLVGGQHRGEPVGDGDGRAALHERPHRCLDPGLGDRVQGGRRLVHDEDARVLQQHPGDGKPLLLAA